MNAGADELLLLRLALLAVVFAFALVAAATMRSGLRSRVRSAPRAADAPPLAAASVVVAGPGQTGIAAGTRFVLSGATVLGRSPDAGIVLGDPSISAEHATLEPYRGRWRLTDLGSTNGTIVNGRHVDERGRLLHAGDVITLGTVLLRFQA